MTKGHSTPDTSPGWTDLFQSLSIPFALLQRQTSHNIKLLRSNKAFQQLFDLQVTSRSQGLNQLPADFINQLQLLFQTQTPVLWCLATDADSCRHFKMHLEQPLSSDPLSQLLVMQDVSEQENALLLQKKQNTELQKRLADIEQLKNRISEQAIRDPLTNLFNRRFLNEFMERELALARRNQKPLAVVMLDLDHFKQLNDQFGHQTGDTVIEMVAKHLLRQSRRTDILFRYGGEEFLVILPNTTSSQARHLAENWRVHVEQAQIFAKHQAVNITLSAGVACYPEHGTTAFNLIQAADEALYQAKAAGRNQVVMC
ncbi:GGDEF domain-containing protein [Rheinheimera sp. 1928-s]|uniref:GGDEF domain-containing protein n=1 Tax=Rheinheimera sp. 1928-s TaxID=3033803 RepID=UPI0026276D90|nr:GGDEF domain-containing protein [Rheinheimera sp. 1928-s]MDF3126664.1 GGDEF domain-containing protein [Rheinheimera sp. 1928-s]